MARLDGFGSGGGVADGMRGLENDQIEELWDDLHLGDLLNDLQRENDALMKARRVKDPFHKRNKVIESPAYNVLMERYHARPLQPKMMSKRTLDRLADPMKGRYESPPKERKKTQKMPPLTDSSHRKVESNRRSRSNEKMERTKERETRSENRRPIPPVRYHSPIREDSPDENSCEEYSPRNRAVERKDSDSFFLTGTMHGEVDIQQSSYHPVMDVRINLDGHRRQSGADRNEEVYTSRTKAYLQEALQRSQTGHGGSEERDRTQGAPAVGKQKKSRALANEQRSFVKEIRSKKSKTKIKSESSRRDQRVGNGARKGRSEGTGEAEVIAPGGRNRRSNPKKESLLPPQQQASKREMSRWGGSRDPLPVTKPVSRRLLAPVAGIQTKKPPKRVKKVAAPDNLVGLERVDEGPSRDGNLVRTNSSSAAMRRTPSSRAALAKGISSGGSNLIGSRSAPTLSRRKVVGSAADGVEGLAQIEETLPAYRGHAPMPSRLLAKGPSRRPPLPAANKSAMRLAPLDAPPLAPEISSHSSISSAGTSTAADKPKSSLHRSSSSSSDFGIGASSSVSSLSVGNKTRLSVASSGGTSDDQLAALFAQHAKKLSQNLEKASNLSLRYQHMKDYDGMTASSRHVDSGSLLPSSKRTPSQQEGNGGEAATPPPFVPPERLSMII